MGLILVVALFVITTSSAEEEDDWSIRRPERGGPDDTGIDDLLR